MILQIRLKKSDTEFDISLIPALLEYYEVLMPNKRKIVEAMTVVNRNKYLLKLQHKYGFPKYFEQFSKIFIHYPAILGYNDTDRADCRDRVNVKGPTNAKVQFVFND